MQMVIWYVTHFEDHFRSHMEHQLQFETTETLRVLRKKLAQAEKRIKELDHLFIRLYEDNVVQKVSDERFVMMSRNYEEEQAALKLDIQSLEQEIQVQEQKTENLEQFIQKATKCKDLDKLTPYALGELVQALDALRLFLLLYMNKAV